MWNKKVAKIECYLILVVFIVFELFISLDSLFKIQTQQNMF